MTAYVIANVKVSDPERYKGYQALSPGAVAAAGGRFIVRGGALEVLEGNWQPGRLVVLEFETMAAARAFYDSELYRQARAARAGATESFDMVCVEGVPAPGQ
ncbi:MAG: DUF1330 domain-containing protein [Burkholderiaceae bacterium]|nr:DUF1330 domain-containing protein [Burkholderiaceae bacterium]